MSPESPDIELLRQYARRGDEAAFAEIVRRHLSLVYASAVRLLNGDTVLAQDVTQAVFVDLARKAATLQECATVAGWLHTSVRFAAANAVRAEQNRRLYEQQAGAMNDQTTSADVSWAQLHPLIDEAVGHLPDSERDAVLLRFFEEKSHRQVGAALGLSEDAARMRVERALEKLRGYFARHGVTTTAALLASTLGAQAAGAPRMPVDFANAVVGNSVAGSAGAGLASTGLISGSGGAGVMAGKATWSVAMKIATILAGMALVATTSVLVYTHFHPVALAQGAQPSPDDAKAEAEYKLGLSLLQSGHATDAIPHFETAIRLKPDFAEAHLGLGDALMKINQAGEAVPEYQIAIRLMPDNPTANNNFGLALLQLGRFAEAAREFEETLRLDPNYPDAGGNLRKVRQLAQQAPSENSPPAQATPPAASSSSK